MRPGLNPFARVELPRLAQLAGHVDAALAGRFAASCFRAMRPGSPDCRSTILFSPAQTVGGPVAARARWKAFLDQAAGRYPELRNQPEAAATSGLSPYLHFGHLSVHEVFHDLARHEGWSPGQLAERVLRFAGRLVGYERAGGGVPGSVGHLRASWGLTAARTERTSTTSARCLPGPRRRSRSTPATIALTPIRWRNSPRPERTIPFGTPPRGNWLRRGVSTTTCGCSGARRYSSGQPALRRPLK